MPEALLVVEEAADAGFKTPEGFVELERRRYDDTEFSFHPADLDYPPPEQPLDIGELQFDVSGPAVIALAGIGDRLPSHAAARSFPPASAGVPPARSHNTPSSPKHA
jgi:hypothetical protein